MVQVDVILAQTGLLAHILQIKKKKTAQRFKSIRLLSDIWFSLLQ